MFAIEAADETAARDISNEGAVGAGIAASKLAVVLLTARLSRPSPPCQGQGARSRFASLDAAASARGMAAIEEDGGGPGRDYQYRPDLSPPCH